MRLLARSTGLARSQGAALVIVLAMVALAMVLVLAVLDTSRSRVKYSRVVAGGLEADALARLPAELVLAQLNAATTQGATPDGELLTWASQPGMIRVFGTTIPKGESRPPALQHYRLYSAPAMTTPTLDAAVEASSLSNWATQPAAYTDLNQPVTARSGGLEYPIADPASLGLVEGFAVNGEPPGRSEAHPLPFPAAWIYVLKDGQMITPVSASGTIARFPAGTASKENPIVGRIAFWTDDESSKLNLNTASEAGPAAGQFATNTAADRWHAEQTPAATDVQCFSGHPAFTSLSPVLATFGHASGGSIQWPRSEPGDPANKDQSDPWLRYLDCYQSLVPYGVRTPSLTSSDLPAGARRHFATVDEFYYDILRRRNGLGTLFQMEPEDLRRSRFFLTTRSSAPEFNPFGGPKLTLWTQSLNPDERSSDDRQIARLSSLNPDTKQEHSFTFQRQSSWSSLDSPGSSQNAFTDWTQVPRNQELYAWLQQMTAKPVPGFGGRLVDKYGVRSRDQILTSIFDLLRTQVNASLPPGPGPDSSLGRGEQSSVPLTLDSNSTRGFGRYPVITEVALVLAFTDVERTPEGLPLDVNQDGICDRATRLRAFVVVNPCTVTPGPPAASPAWTLRFRQLMHWSISSGIGLQLPGGNIFDRCTFSGSLGLQGGPAWGGNNSAYAGFAAQFLQADGTPKQIGKREDPARDYPFISQNDITLPSSDGRPGSTLKFSGGRIRVDVMPVDAVPSSPRPGDSLHSVEMDFPSSADPAQQIPLPMPSLQVADFAAGPRSLASRFQPVRAGAGWRLPLIQRGDIVRSLVLNANGPSRGDVRQLAARREVVFPEAENWFAPHPKYGTPATPLNERVLEAHSLRDGAHLMNGQFGSTPMTTRDTAGSLVPNAAFADNAIPAVPVATNGATQIAVGSDPGGRPGDWETGPGVLEDGGFVYRPALDLAGSFNRAAQIFDTKDSSPFQQMPCATAFGAIPSGAYGGRLPGNGGQIDATPRPWQTLLFCASPAGRTSSSGSPGKYDSTTFDHFGFASPPDHVWLDFFWLPVTRPWAMSQNFATEGKVNLNSRLMPFSWLRRSTAMHGVLHGVRMTAIPTRAFQKQDGSAKGHDDGSPLDLSFRYEVNARETLAAMEQRFDDGDVFRTPSEICNVPLVPRRISGHAYENDDIAAENPDGRTARTMTGWWNGDPSDPADAFEATGDNLREAPYGQIYPRVCTQSNVFRVHYAVQMLGKVRSTRPEEWDETKNQVISERRGSDVIERRLQTSAAPLPDSATDPKAPALGTCMKFQVLSREVFSP